jgi:signal transduction histidine kinase
MSAGGTVAITTFHVEPIEKSSNPAHRTSNGIGVTDTGGMPPRVLRRAFDLFYTAKSHGTGPGAGDD